MATSVLRASVTANNLDPQDGASAEILVDGSDTPIHANGLTGYIPTPGDRLLVQQVGGQVEVIQFVSRGTVPYLGAADLSVLQAEIDNNTDSLADHAAQISATNDAVTDLATSTADTLATLQSAYAPLSGIGAAGVEEDYFWVGDDPTAATTKLVQISTYVQSGLYAGDSATLAAVFNYWNRDSIGDVEYTGSITPPMTTFYTVFTDSGRSAEPWN